MKGSKKELLRWALADQAFREADALAEHIIESKMDWTSDLFRASVAGVAVSYCRPFLSSTGLGPLPDDMSQFTGETNEAQLRETHETLIEARHKIAAHFDRNHSEDKFRAGHITLPPSEIRIELEMHRFGVSTNATYLNPQRLIAARHLFAFQICRVSRCIGLFAIELAKQEKKLGMFVFQVP